MPRLPLPSQTNNGRSYFGYYVHGVWQAPMYATIAADRLAMIMKPKPKTWACSNGNTQSRD